MNKLDPDFQFIFKAFNINVNFLDISFKVIKKNYSLIFTTNLHICLVTFKKLSLTAREQQIALSLARRIARIVADNKNNRLPEKIIEHSFTKLF